MEGKGQVHLGPCWQHWCVSSTAELLLVFAGFALAAKRCRVRYKVLGTAPSAEALACVPCGHVVMAQVLGGLSQPARGCSDV